MINHTAALCCSGCCSCIVILHVSILSPLRDVFESFHLVGGLCTTLLSGSRVDPPHNSLILSEMIHLIRSRGSDVWVENESQSI